MLPALFLAVIAATSALQTVALFVIWRRAQAAEQRAAELQKRFETEVLPRLRQAAVTAAAVEAYSQQALDAAVRVDAYVERGTARLQRTLDQVPARLARHVEAQVDARLASATSRVIGSSRPLVLGLAFYKGLRRGYDFLSR
jgi:hypothetical protein